MVQGLRPGAGDQILERAVSSREYNSLFSGCCVDTKLVCSVHEACEMVKGVETISNFKPFEASPERSACF